MDRLSPAFLLAPLANTLRLRRIGLSFRCTHHAGDLEILESDEVVVIDELSAQLVGGIAPLILDLAMKSHDLFNLTSSAIRSALFGCEVTLGLSEVLLRFGPK